MREGWNVKTLAELCEFRNGLWKGKIPPFIHVGVIRNTNFRSDGSLDDSNIAFLDVEEKLFINRQLQHGDLILEKSGGGPKQPVGRVVFFDKTDGLYSFSNFTSIIRVVDPSTLDSRYLHRILYWYYMSGITEGMQRQSTGIRNLEFKAYKNISIPLPPLPEQQRIVEILDEAFAAIDTARANTEKNLASAREVFESSLKNVFNQNESLPIWLTTNLSTSQTEDSIDSTIQHPVNAFPLSTTRGRAATERIIAGDLSLSVGQSPISPRSGWTWSLLTDIAQLESGHTPSRRYPEYWDGDVPWIGIKDAKINHGQVIEDTLQHTNQLGIDNSAARLLPKGTVCLSRTASVGYVVVMGRTMSTSQDFVNWICSDKLDPHFLKYLLLAEGEDLLKYSSGSVHQTIYFPEVKAFYICYPNVEIQRRIVNYLDQVQSQSKFLENILSQKLTLLAELKQSLLHKAFTGELTADFTAVDRALEEAGV